MTYQALAFFDLDGTLLNEKSQVTPEIAASMQQLRKNNVLPIIATGRTESEIQTIKQASGITSNIVMNGAFIRIDGHEVYSDTLTKELCGKMYEAALDQGDQLSYYNETGYWCTGINQELHGAYDYVHSPLPAVQPLRYLNERVNMMLVLGVDNKTYYQTAFPELTFYQNTPFSIDVVKNGTSKGTGVKTLLERMDLQGIPTYAFGDGNNDFALLEACDHKIAMGNAVDSLKEIADFVTYSHTEGGIRHALEHYGLL